MKTTEKMALKNKYFLLVLILSFLSGCRLFSDENVSNDLFYLTSPDDTGIEFQNTLEFNKSFNIYTYRNYYNGGGVAIGDINNDGLSDIYFVANSKPNELYLNNGQFRFENITETANVAGAHAWSTGVVMVDINADGWLDIYVCNSGTVEGDIPKNELFINNGDLTFTEKAQDYGLDDESLSTHATFFDYDLDGDLDAYVLNNSFKAIGSFDLDKNERQERDPAGGDKLFRNDDGIFKDVSEEAGIYGSIIAFGLGVLASDLDNDGWTDLYICNDFFERDYIYMNNGNGTFREELPAQMRSISMASMGVDIADVNNDGFQDVFVTEMLPKSEPRLKTAMTFEDWGRYQANVKSGYHYQLTRNMLHLSNGFIKDDQITFSERGRLAGVEATDWSWGVLLADLDLNGHKDIYISNGVFQDILNQDYLRHISTDVVMRNMITTTGVNYEKLIQMIPSHPLSNVAYSGNPSGIFEDSTTSWGLEQPGFSNGMAYGDLDNDGDLDLVVNNVNMNAFVYKNQTVALHPDKRFLKIKLEGSGQNKFAIGARVSVYQKESIQVNEQMPSRGFQSSVDYILNFGLASNALIDSVKVDWPGGTKTILKELETNQLLIIKQSDAGSSNISGEIIFKENPDKFLFQDFSNDFPDDFSHQENEYNDFEKDALIFQMNSTEGAKISVGDVDGNGTEDVFLCGAKGFPGKLFLQNKNGNFDDSASQAFEEDARCEDVDALFFDADQDNDLDLYVVSGGNEYPSSSSALSDRLYVNDGKGVFMKSNQLLPTTKFESTSCVRATDIDSDGDIDLFVGVRLKDRNYGIPQNGYILENDGKGFFTDITSTIAPDLLQLGLIKDALWVDYNGDGLTDLIVVGEWMAIEVFENNGSSFDRVTQKLGLSEYGGWWNTIEASDIDNDGDLDFIIGNHGLNSRFKATYEKPLTWHVNDFDQNGTVEQIISAYNGDVSYPLPLRHDLVKQLPYLSKKYPGYADYKEQKIEDIFDAGQIHKSVVQKVSILESVVLINNEGKNFSIIPLPLIAQTSPVYAIYTDDFNKDGNQDLLLGGNLLEVKPEMGPYDASFGTCLLGNGDGTFTPVRNDGVGLLLNGQIRDIESINLGTEKVIIVSGIDQKIQAFKISPDPFKSQ